MLQQQYLMWRGQVMGRSVEGPEAEAVETMVLAERAKQMGLVITDQMINDLIKQVSGDNLTPAEVQAVVQNLQPQRPVSVPKLFDALRTELLASKYRDLFAQSLAEIPPAQRFEYYSRLNRRAKAEVMQLAVADFVGQVADPSESELKTFYEKYKDQLPDPTSPEPGFKEPRRASFQYFKGNVDQLTEKLKDQVTEEEIKKYYEDNKRNFIVTNFDDVPADMENANEEPNAAKEGEAPSEKPADEKPVGETKSAAEPEPKEESAKPQEEESPEPKAEDTPELSSEDKPAEEPPSEPDSSGDQNKDEPAESPQAAVRQPNGVFRGAGQKFRFVKAVLQGDDAQGEDASETNDEAPIEPEPADSKPAETPSAEEKPADAAESKPAANETPADQPAEEKPVEEKPAADHGDEIVAEPPVPEGPQYEPLEKVQDTIRETLARERAAEQLSEQFDALSAKMRRFTDDHDIYITDKPLNPDAVAPTPLDFAQLASGKDVEALELKSVTPLQAAKEDIGKSFRVVQDPNGGARTVAFVDFAFADRLPTYKPEIDRDNENNYYLFWKTQEEPSYVPPLDQIHDEVVRTWKMVKARDLARKRAEEYVQQAKSQNQTLEELFGKQPDFKVTQTSPFSWLTLGNVPAQPGSIPRLSEVEGVDQAGPDFMKTVFGLQPGGLGVATNVPQDLVYVVRVIDYEPSGEQLRDDFARENPSRYMAAAREDQFQIYENWIADLNKEADVKWLRQADARRQSAQESEF